MHYWLHYLYMTLNNKTARVQPGIKKMEEGHIVL